MTGNDLYYDGVWLSDLGLIMYDPDDDQEWVERDFITTDQNGRRAEQTYYGENYDGTLTLSFLIGKNPSIYHTQKEQRFSQDDINSVRKWLESPKLPKELICKKDDSEQISYFGVFQQAQPFLVETVCYGIYFTFQCNAAHGYSPIQKKEFSLSSSTTVNGTFECSTSDKYSYTFPIINIYINSAITNKGKLTITNKTDNNSSMSFNIPNTDYITINTKTKQIYKKDGTLLDFDSLGWNSSSIFDYSALFSNTVSLYWLRLLDGTNNITFTQTVANAISKIEIQARFIRKADGFLNV